VRRRLLADRAVWALCAIAFACIAAPVVSVLVSVVHQSLPALGLSLLTKRTNSVGVQNAILGTLLLLGGVLVIAGSIGVAAGTYLAEFASGRVGVVLRYFSDVLAGMPSIVIGYVGYVTLVVEFHWGFSLLGATLALSVLVVPYIVKSTEVAFRQVPTSLREAASGVGLRGLATVGRVLLPPALPGIVSGIIAALAISTGSWHRFCSQPASPMPTRASSCSTARSPT